MPRKSNLQSDRLAKLEERKKKLQEQILREKNELRDRSNVRAVVRARALGEALMRLAQDGRLDDRLLRMLKDDLWAHVDASSPQFESLNGTEFDLSERLHDMSIAV